MKNMVPDVNHYTICTDFFKCYEMVDIFKPNIYGHVIANDELLLIADYLGTITHGILCVIRQRFQIKGNVGKVKQRQLFLRRLLLYLSL